MGSNLFPEFNMKGVAEIAALLRDEGDQILNYSCKLSLTVQFLLKLSEAFDVIVDNIESSCFQVINTNNSSVEIFHDLQFLHDFIQKVLGLRLWNRSSSVGTVNLKKFRSLRTLELYAVNISNIDFSSTRDRLTSFTCTRSNVRDLKILFEEVVSESEGDVDSSKVWTCLEEMFLPFNDLTSIGNLRCAPNLRLLDLSHNNLTNLSALENSLEHLEWLNLAYNKLKSLPCLSCCTKLKVLSLSDNRLEDLKGLATLCSLVNLDASRNLISEHSNLSDLMYLPNLKHISFEGNPITFKRGHRLLTIAFINPIALATHAVVLDKLAVSHIEKSHFPQKRPFHLNCHGVMADNEPSCSCPQAPKAHRTHLTKYMEDKKIDLTSGGRAVKIREAPIAEGESSVANKPPEKEMEQSERSGLHLETKRDIEKIRRTYGEENWLQGGGGLKILDILGIKIESPNECVVQAEVHVKEASEEEEAEVEEEDKEEVVEAKEHFVEEIGAELGVYVAQRKGFEKDQLMDDILLTLTDKYLVERNGTSGKLVTKWHLNELQGVRKEKETESGTWLHLTFKSRFETSEKPGYFMDNEEAEELHRNLLKVLEKIQIDGINSTILFTCIRCSANFPEIKTTESFGKEEEGAATPNCPKCGSTVVVQASLSTSDHASPAADALCPIREEKKDLSIPSLGTQFANPFANWGELSSSQKSNFEATCHGLQLYVMLNILPDGDAKEREFQIHEALVYLVSSEESFHGYIVLSKDSIYVLKDSERDGRRDSLNGDTNPVLANWYPLTKCEGIIATHCGFLLRFESQICVFPQNKMELQNDLLRLCPSQLHLDELEASSSDVLLKLPLISFQTEDHMSKSGPDLRLGMLVLTCNSISIMNFKELQNSQSNLSQDAFSTHMISDLVALKATESPFLHQPGVMLQFTGETDDLQLAVWPWGKGMLLEFIEALRKPWESLFSIPLETIAVQSVCC